MNQTRLENRCSKCKHILYEATLPKPCPYCGSFVEFGLQKIENKVVFQSASSVPRLATGIAKMDAILHFLSMGQKVVIIGPGSQKLIERLAVRAQLTNRYGGLDSHVIIIDGGNSSDPYLCVNFVRQYGLDMQDALSKIISSRAFTIYQLENLITRELQNIIQKYDAKFIIISDLFAMFVNDPYLDKNDVIRLLDSIFESILKLNDCIVVISISKLIKYWDNVMKSFNRIIVLSNKKDSIIVKIDHNDPFVMKMDEMEIVSQVM